MNNLLQLKIDGLVLALTSTPRGPVISLDAPEAAPLAWIVNLAVDGGLTGLRDRIAEGEVIHYRSLHAIPSTGAESRLVYTLSADFLQQQITLPAETILEVLARLESLRRASAPQHHPSPEISSSATAPRAEDIQDLVASPEPQHQPRLSHGQAFWEDLERRAVEIDQLAAGTRTPESAAQEAVKRRFFLIELDAAGLLGEAPPELLMQLQDWRFAHLLEYHAAALQIWAYFASAERHGYLREAPPERVLGSSVSVDWMRLRSPVPEGFSFFEWLAHCEYVLKHVEVNGGEGEVMTKARGKWWQLYWRRDDGIHPALVQTRAAQ